MTLSRQQHKSFTKLSTEAGFTLIELLVVMGIFIVVIMISANAFERIAKVASQQTASSGSNIQGIVGLEIMRSDLERAGYGLPWPAPSSVTLFTTDESLVAANTLANGIDPKTFNDKNIPVSVDPYKAPRAIQSAAATGAGAWENGRDYLVIKATSLGMSAAAKKWSYLEGVGATTSIKEWGNTDDFVPNDRVITLRSITEESKPYRELIGPSSDAPHFSYAVGAKSAGKYLAPAGYQAGTSDIYVAYGVNSQADHSDPGALRAPYNRVDYYIKRPSDIPARCAPGTGVLYKANLNHNSSGDVTTYPLLECVADMQVIYSYNTTPDVAGSGVNYHDNDAYHSTLSAQTIRDQLREIRVYILAQEGQKDPSYTYPTSTVQVGYAPYGRAYDLTALDGIGNGWKNYRWKIYTMVVSPKNINN